MLIETIKIVFTLFGIILYFVPIELQREFKIEFDTKPLTKIYNTNAFVIVMDRFAPGGLFSGKLPNALDT